MNALALLAAGSGRGPVTGPCLFLLVEALFVGLFVFGYATGWKRLQRRFPAPIADLPGPKFNFLSGRVGRIAFRSSLFAQVTPEGLRLSVFVLFRWGHGPLLIPWTEIRRLRFRNVLWKRMVEFDVGEPALTTILLPDKVFAASPVRPVDQPPGKGPTLLH